jgi:TolB-like protein/DNA-binding winged helix-turn-helix (wHTH) protein/Tfp pilus assembly protein PilF
VTAGLFRFGDFKLDPAQFELRRAGHRIPLERKPLEVLILLAEKQGKLVMREEIIEQVWGKDFAFDAERGVNNVMRKLRAALHDNPDRPRFVETVVGKGYRFIGPIEELARPIAGQRPPKESESARPLPAQSRKAASRLILAIVASLALGLLVWRGVATLRSQRGAGLAANSVRSIAVLPFTNLSGDPNQEYFADGMTEELATELGKFSALRVISHTSVNRFKGAKTPLQEIAKELQIDAVMEGTVTREGDRVRVTANLIRAFPEKHLWAESYDRDIRNVLDLQSEVARAIADQIRITVTPEERRHLTTSQTVDPEAHELYLKGMFYNGKWTKEGFERGVEYFNRALEKEPRNARAYAGLAVAYGGLGIYDDVEAYPKQKAASLKALEIDDTLADAHSTLAWAKFTYDWDIAGAEREFRRAIELNPSDARARAWYGIFLAMLGRIEESLLQVKSARELDPLSLANTSLAYKTYYNAREYDKAIEVCRNALDMDPNFVSAHWKLVGVYQRTGAFEKAIEERRRLGTLGGEELKGVSRQAELLRKAYAAKGPPGYWLQELEILRAEPHPGNPIYIAAIYTRLGQEDEAFRWLDVAFKRRLPHLIWDLPANPDFDDLRSDPRYADLLRRIVPRSE